MAKILGKTHKPKVLGADTHSVSLKEQNGDGLESATCPCMESVTKGL